MNVCAIAGAAALLSFLSGALAGTATARPVVDVAEVRDAIRLAWEDEGPAGCELEVRVLPNLLGDDACPCEFAVELPDDPGRPGPRIVPVSCIVEGRSISRGLASVLVKAEREVWIAPGPFARGAVVKRGDLTRETRIVEREPRGFFVPEEGARYRLARDIAPGAPIQSSDLRRVPDVATGDPVTLVAAAGQARVGVQGKARRGGCVGDVILVQNPVSGALVRAQLIDVATAILVATPAAFVRERKSR